MHSISPGDRCENGNQRETFPGKDERFFSREHQSMEVKEAPLVLYEIHNMTNIWNQMMSSIVSRLKSNEIDLAI